jgi:hypothetical protein
VRLGHSPVQRIGVEGHLAQDFQPLRVVDNPRLTGMRRWCVRGFDNYLIFYQPLSQDIEVLRVVYATRDLPGLFLSEQGEA